MDSALYTIITSVTALTDELGDRVTPIIRAQGEGVPALTYRKVSSSRPYDQDGIAMVDQSFDLHIYAMTYGNVQHIIELIEDNLSGISGTYAGRVIEEVTVEEVGNDDFIEDEQLYTDSIEIKVRFKE